MWIEPAFDEMRRKVVDEHTRKLAEATGAPVDEVTGRALRDVATVCGPSTIEALVVSLHRLRAPVPHRVGTCPVVAFIRYGAADGMQPVRGVAVTAERDRYNVHTVSYDERTARWEGQNGHYGVTWEAARDELNRRADGEARP
ncbi:MAG TPA: hypothetical protein VF755_04695 [Catenuloplanes sp.]|jgi:hypothetical protein